MTGKAISYIEKGRDTKVNKNRMCYGAKFTYEYVDQHDFVENQKKKQNYISTLCEHEMGANIFF